MARRNDSWGIEVGANAIKAIRLVRSGKTVHVEDWDVVPFKHVLTTPDLNVDEAIQVNLDAFLQKHDLSKSNVVVSVPGHMAFARFAKLPPVEPKKIPDIVRFEAVQQIPFPIDQVEWDYQVFQQQDSPDVEVGIFAITKERVATFLSNYRQVGMKVDALTLSPLAVYNAFAYDGADADEPNGTIYMDIGTQSTDVIIVEDGGIWLRTLPIGGNNFTDALVKSFKLSFSKAEKLKKEAGTSKYARQIFQAMRPVFADLVQELQRSLGYYQSMNRDAELTRLVGVGSTFKLPGLQKFLKQQLQMEVVRPDGFKRISVEGKQQSEFSEHALNFATAYGLALQGVGLETVTANILPQAILRQRMWKAKQPWIAAAAACVAVASGLAGARYFMDARTYRASVEASTPRITPVVSGAQRFVSEWDQIAQGSDPRLRIENLRRILDYRDVWPKLLEDVTLAAARMGPQPETISADYDALANIPPQQRSRFYIQEMRVEYLVGDPAQQPADPQQLIAQHYDASTFFAEGARPPRFQITITGTTPHADAVKVVSSGFVGWLRANAQRKDRPYKIVVQGNPILRQWPVQPMTAATPGAARTGFAPPRATFGGNQGVGAPPWAAPGSAAGAGGISELLPTRPVEEHRATGFEIQWTVELVKPEDARRTEDRQRGPAPQPQQPQPSAAAPPSAPADEAVAGAEEEVSS